MLSGDPGSGAISALTNPDMNGSCDVTHLNSGHKSTQTIVGSFNSINHRIPFSINAVRCL